jgi:hypothetical protein
MPLRVRKRSKEVAYVITWLHYFFTGSAPQSRQRAKLFLQSSELGLPQPLTSRRVCPPPSGSGGRCTLTGERGVGRVPIPTRGIHCGTLQASYIRTLCFALYESNYGLRRLQEKHVMRLLPPSSLSLSKWTDDPYLASLCLLAEITFRIEERVGEKNSSSDARRNIMDNY